MASVTIRALLIVCLLCVIQVELICGRGDSIELEVSLCECLFVDHSAYFGNRRSLGF